MERESALFIGDILAERNAFSDALKAILDGDCPRPVGKSWFPDGRPNKNDQCTHGVFMYEPCENCVDAFIMATFEANKPKP